MTSAKLHHFCSLRLAFDVCFVARDMLRVHVVSDGVVHLNLEAFNILHLLNKPHVYPNTLIAVSLSNTGV